MRSPGDDDGAQPLWPHLVDVDHSSFQKEAIELFRGVEQAQHGEEAGDQPPPTCEGVALLHHEEGAFGPAHDVTEEGVGALWLFGQGVHGYDGAKEARSGQGCEDLSPLEGEVFSQFRCVEHTEGACLVLQVRGERRVSRVLTREPEVARGGSPCQ